MLSSLKLLVFTDLVVSQIKPTVCWITTNEVKAANTRIDKTVQIPNASAKSTSKSK